MKALRKLIPDDQYNQRKPVDRKYYRSGCRKARRLVRKSYGHLYAHYEELAEGGINDMMEEALVD